MRWTITYGRTTSNVRTSPGCGERLRPRLRRTSGNRPRWGSGKPFPSPPECLHECGRFRGTGESPEESMKTSKVVPISNLTRKARTLSDFRNCRCIGATPGASNIFLNKTDAVTLSFPSPPLFLHDSPCLPQTDGRFERGRGSGACSAGSWRSPDYRGQSARALVIILHLCC